MPKDAENKAQDGIEDGQKDPSQDPSKAKDSKPSSTKGKTYSESEVKALLAQRHAALDSQISILTKENRRLKPFEQQAKDAEQEASDAKEEARRVKAEIAKKDADFSSIFAAEEDIEAERAKLKKERRAMEAEKTEWGDELADLNVSKHERAVKTVAEEAGVSSELLLSLFPTPIEGLDLKAVASKLPKATTQKDEKGEEGEEGDINKSPWGDWQPDSGLTTGGEGDVEKQLAEAAERGDMKTYAKLRGHDKLVKKE